MAFDFRKEEDIKQYIHNLGIEYRFGCYKEKNPEACHLLGDYLEAVKTDYVKAGKVYKDNCENGNFGKSCLKIGNYSFLGRGEVKESQENALKYFIKGCELGAQDSCVNAGMMLTSASEDVKTKRDYVKGVECLKKGCELNNQHSCHFLSGFFISGSKDGSFPKDMAQAFQYATKACELGNMYACANVSQMYHKGEGVASDLEKAKYFKRKALDMQDDVKSNRTLTFQQGLDPT